MGWSREGLSEVVTFKLRLECGKGAKLGGLGVLLFQAEKRTHAKILRLKVGKGQIK